MQPSDGLLCAIQSLTFAAWWPKLRDGKWMLLSLYQLGARNDSTQPDHGGSKK